MSMNTTVCHYFTKSKLIGLCLLNRYEFPLDFSCVWFQITRSVLDKCPLIINVCFDSCLILSSASVVLSHILSATCNLWDGVDFHSLWSLSNYDSLWYCLLQPTTALVCARVSRSDVKLPHPSIHPSSLQRVVIY